MNSSADSQSSRRQLERSCLPVAPDLSLSRAVAESRCGTLPHGQRRTTIAVENGRLLGYLCDRRLLQHLAQPGRTAEDPVRVAIVPLPEYSLRDGFPPVLSVPLLVRDRRNRPLGILSPPSETGDRPEPFSHRLRDYCLPLPPLSSRTSLRDVAGVLCDTSAVVLSEPLGDDRHLPVGILTHSDLLQALHLDLDRTLARDLMSSPPFVLPEDASPDGAYRLLKQHRISHLVVLNRYGEYVGLVRDRDLPSPAKLQHSLSYTFSRANYRRLQRQTLALHHELASQQQLETKLRTSEAQVRDCIESMTDIVLILDRHLQTIQIIPTACEQFDPSGSDLLERTVTYLNDFKVLPQLLAVLRRVAQTQGSETYNYVLPATPSQPARAFSARLSPLNRSDRLLWVARDVSEEVGNRASDVPDVLPEDVPPERAASASGHNRDRGWARSTATWLHLLQRAVETLHNGVIIADAQHPDLPIVYVNQGFEQTTGYRREEAIGRNCRFLQGVHRQQPALAEIRAALAEQRPIRVTLLNTRKDGSNFWNDLTLSPVRDNTGVVSHYVGIQHDVTARYDSERHLNELIAQLRAILDAAPDLAIVATDLDGTISLFSHGAEQMLGYDRHEIVGQHSLLRFHDRDEILQRAGKSDTDIGNLFSDLAGLAFQGNTDSQDWTYRRQDGSTLAVHLTLAPIRQHDAIVGFLGIAQDISDRRATEAQLQQQTELLQKIFDCIPISIAAFDPDGQPLLVNRHLEDTFGWSAAELAEIDLLAECYPNPDDLEAVRQCVREADGNWYDFYTQTRSGKQLHTSWANLRLSDGSFVGIGQDITQRKQAELDTLHAKERFELVIRAANDGFWDWDFQTDEIYFSPRWKAMLGYRDDELPNTLDAWKGVIFEEDYHIALQRVADYNSGRVDRFQVFQRFHHKDGSTVHILSRAIHLKNAEGEVVRMVGAHTDVTELVRVQQALRDSQLQLDSILNSSLDGIMAFRSLRDETGAIVDFEWLSANAAASEMVGRPADDLIGKRLLVEMPGNRSEGLFDDYVRVVETGIPAEREFFYDRDGISSWFQNIAVKLGDGFAVTFRNVTKLKQAEQGLQEANVQLEGRVAELKQRNEEMRILGELNDFLQSCRTVEEAYTAAATLIQPLFQGYFIL